jgi:hypothetical protein
MHSSATRVLFVLAIVAGCSGADTDGGSDSGTDAGAFLPSDSGSGGSPDSGAADSGHDAGPADAGADAGLDAGFDSGITLDELERRWPNAACRRLVRCGLFEDVARCEALIVSRYRLELDLGAERAGIEAGTILFHGSAAKLCLDSLGSLPGCHVSKPDVELLEPGRFNAAITSGLASVKASRDTFEGTIADGGECSTQEECAEGWFCDSSMPICPSTCVPQGEPNESPGANPGCSTALFVNRCVDASITCREDLYLYQGVCLPPVAIGASCQPLAPGAPERRCVPLGFCDPATEVCLARKSTGAFCSDDSECRDGFLCPDAICEPRSIVGADCFIDSCPLDLRCEYDLAFCTTLIPNGGACNWTLECGAGLTCNFSRGECVPLSAAGGFCDDIQSCEPGQYCDSSLGRCAPRIARSQPCPGAPLDCRPGLFCDVATSTCFPQSCRPPGF